MFQDPFLGKAKNVKRPTEGRGYHDSDNPGSGFWAAILSRKMKILKLHAQQSKIIILCPFGPNRKKVDFLALFIDLKILTFFKCMEIPIYLRNHANFATSQNDNEKRFFGSVKSVWNFRFPSFRIGRRKGSKIHSVSPCKVINWSKISIGN